MYAFQNAAGDQQPGVMQGSFVSADFRYPKVALRCFACVTRALALLTLLLDAWKKQRSLVGSTCVSVAYRGLCSRVSSLSFILSHSDVYCLVSPSPRTLTSHVTRSRNQVELFTCLNGTHRPADRPCYSPEYIQS